MRIERLTVVQDRLWLVIKTDTKGKSRMFFEVKAEVEITGGNIRQLAARLNKEVENG